MNTWPNDVRKAMHQRDHESWNSSRYPGTRQLCCKCEEPTGRCEEDSVYNEDGLPLCDDCYDDELK
jgi:hypothetical protein